MNNYFTIKELSKGEHQIKGSKYIGFSFPIININQVKYNLQNLKKKHSNASHICYAYRILKDNNINDFSTDSGEPRGSAGLPILNVLKSKNIINTVVYIIRYFGGSKLGISGLIKSYSIATENTVNNSILTHYIRLITIEISFEVKYNSRIEALIKKYNGIAIHKEFFSEIIYSVSIQEGKKNIFLSDVHNITNGNIKIINKSFE